MRLTDSEAEAIYEELALPEQTRKFIRDIRSGQPVRRSNRRINITGRFPSSKMGLTIQYESRSGEGLACMFYESDGEVLEFYDQPYHFRVAYAQPGSTATHIEHTPDFLVIRRAVADDGTIAHSITFEEWRESARMAGLGTADPKRWSRLPTGDWTQLPIEEYLRELALGYRIRIIDTTPSFLARNYDLLSDHFLDPQPINEELLRETRQVVGTNLGISLHEARIALPNLTVDDVLAMLAQGKLSGNLRSALLTDHAALRLFIDPQLQSIVEGRSQPVERGEVVADAGAQVRLGEETFEILSTSADKVYLSAAKTGRIREIPLADFTRLAEAGDIVGISDGRTDLATAMLESDPSLVLLANQRLKMIEPYLANGGYPQERTTQRWLAAYRQAEELHGDGFIGLIAETCERGNREPRLAEDSEEIAAKVIKEQLLRPDQLTLRKAHAIYVEECAEAKPPVHAMGLSSFHARYKVLSNVERLRARVGGRAASAAAMRSPRGVGGGGYRSPHGGGLYLPPHGDRAFARVHIDHTTLDIATCDSATGEPLGKPECTLVKDAFSGRVLVALVLYQKPSAETDMLALRELVRRYHQMPTTIVVDGGSDFTSKYFEALCAALKTKVEHRRTGVARDGGPVESGFKQLDTDLIWTLTGNTQIRKHVRAMGQEHDPDKRAIWTLAALQEELDRYVEFKNDQPVRGLGGSPREIFEKSMADAGPRAFRRIAFNTAFRALTAHHTKNGSRATVDREGVRIRNIQYMCAAFRQPGVEGTKVKVRYEPLDARVAYARVNKVWHVCHAEYRELTGRTEREMAAASQELRRRLGKEPSMHELAVYLRQVQEREVSLSKEKSLRQRRAAEQAAVVAGRDGPDENAIVESTPEPIDGDDAASASESTAAETVAAVEIDLDGYEQPTDEELRDLEADANGVEEAA